MDHLTILQFFTYLAELSLSSVRLLPLFFLMPFLSHSLISNTIRMPVVMLMGAALWPHSWGELNSLPIGQWFWLIGREAFIGLVLAVVLAWPFWVMHGLGSLIDFQRGATISSTLDPVSGVDASELANLFNLYAAAVFLQGGGLGIMVQLYADSFRLCGPLSECTPVIGPMLAQLSELMVKMIVLASPVLIALLLTEVILGLLSRFAPQMNAFSISLTIKSIIAFLMLVIYFSMTVPSAFRQMWPAHSSWRYLLIPVTG